MDKSDKKVSRIKENCKNQGLNNVVSFVCDATKAVNKDINGERDVFEGPPFSRCSFDHILLDAPCSALGQRPRIRQSVSIQNLNSHPNLQKRLFRTVSFLMDFLICLVDYACLMYLVYLLLF